MKAIECFFHVSINLILTRERLGELETVMRIHPASQEHNKVGRVKTNAIVNYFYTQVLQLEIGPLVTSERVQISSGGSVVEFSPATREDRVRFPASATPF